MVDRSDPAFPFVAEARAKQAAHAAKRASRKEPSPWLNIGVMCVLLGVALTHLMEDALFYAGVFTALAAFNGYTARRVLWQRSKAS